MRTIRVRAFSMAAMTAIALSVVGCGGDDNDDGGPPPTSTSPVADDGASRFDVGMWRSQWTGASDGYASAVTTYLNQVDYLLSNNASDAQIAEAVARLAGDVQIAGRDFLTALDTAEAVPAERPDVQRAAATLQQAVEKQTSAYGALAACGTSQQCQISAFTTVNATAGPVDEAIQAIPAR